MCHDFLGLDFYKQGQEKTSLGTRDIVLACSGGRRVLDYLFVLFTVAFVCLSY